jgi:hypothetical protein
VLLGELQEALGPEELRRQHEQAGDDDQPAGTRQRDRHDAERDDEPAEHADDDAVRMIDRPAGGDPAAPAGLGDAFAQTARLVGVVPRQPLVPGLPALVLGRSDRLVLAQLVTYPCATISVGLGGA